MKITMMPLAAILALTQLVASAMPTMNLDSENIGVKPEGLAQPEPKLVTNTPTFDKAGFCSIVMTKRPIFQDLDAGLLLTPPAELLTPENQQALTDWAKEKGVDLVSGLELPAKKDQKCDGLIVLNTFAQPTDNTNWDGDKVMASEMLGSSSAQYSPLEIQEDGKFPQTWLVRTNDKSFVILQVLTSSEMPYVVSIRYKLLKQKEIMPDPAAPESKRVLLLIPTEFPGQPKLVVAPEVPVFPGMPNTAPSFAYPKATNLKNDIFSAAAGRGYPTEKFEPIKPQSPWTVRFADPENDVYIGEPMAPDFFFGDDMRYSHYNRERYERSRDYLYDPESGYKSIEIKYEFKWDD